MKKITAQLCYSIINRLYSVMLIGDVTSTELSEWPKQSKPANNYGTLSYFGADFMGLFQVGAASIQDGFYFNSIKMEKSI